MTALEKLIIEEVESTSLDFKAIQYRKDKFENFLVDVISMANANIKAPKYIVIGVKAYPSGKKDFIGIKEEFIDEATYQQLVNDNIEPDVRIDYFPVTINDVPLAAFYISDCGNPPYMLKKDYGKLKRGDSFIRKGTHQTRVNRRDIDQFYRIAYENKQRIEDIQVSCQVNNIYSDEIKLIMELKTPSYKAAEKIKKVLAKKEEELARLSGSSHFLDIDMAQLHGRLIPYEQRSTKTLKENLRTVSETYLEDDLYYIFEEQSYKINFELLNSGNTYLEDASIEIEVDKSEGLVIATDIVDKPERRDWLDSLRRPVIPPNLDKINYPEILETKNVYKIFANIGNIKHLIPTFAFKTPIRLVLVKTYPLDILSFNIKIFGKTLEKPISKTLELRVTK